MMMAPSTTGAAQCKTKRRGRHGKSGYPLERLSVSGFWDWITAFALPSAFRAFLRASDSKAGAASSAINPMSSFNMFPGRELRND